MAQQGYELATTPHNIVYNSNICYDYIELRTTPSDNSYLLSMVITIQSYTMEHYLLFTQLLTRYFESQAYVVHCTTLRLIQMIADIIVTICSVGRSYFVSICTSQMQTNFNFHTARHVIMYHSGCNLNKHYLDKDGNMKLFQQS